MEEEVEDPPYASNIKQGIAPLVKIADLNTRVVVVAEAMVQVVAEAMAQVADMVEVTKDTEVEVEVMGEDVVLAVAVVVEVAEFASTTRKVLVHMVPTADLSINRLFMKLISKPEITIILTYLSTIGMYYIYCVKR